MKKINYIKLFFAAGFCLTFWSCQTGIDNKTIARQIVEKYGEQNGELGKLYDYAIRENDDDIIYLMANMINKSGNGNHDVLKINADSLIASVKHSRKVWKELPWSGQYTEEQFREYVLTYRMNNEPLEYYWKQDAYSKYFLPFEDGEKIEDYAERYNIGTGFKINTKLEGNKYSYSNLSEVKTGSCMDWALFSILSLRAAGIPAAEHVIVYWGDYNAKHTIPTLIFPDETSLSFEDVHLAENTMDKSIPKLYRRMGSVQTDTPVYKYRNKEDIPAAFAPSDLKDVSGKYPPMHVRDVEVKIPRSLNRDNKILYMGVFSTDGWVPVAYAEKKGRRAFFGDMGTGHQQDGTFIPNVYDIGEGILYLPGFYISGRMVPVGQPMIVGRDETRILSPDTLNTRPVVLNRKFPFKSNTLHHFHEIMGSEFEATDDFKSGKWDLLHKVYLSPRQMVQKVAVEKDKRYRYARVRVPHGRLSIAEMKFYDQDGNPIKGRIISDDYVPWYGEVEDVFDGDPLTYITTESTFDVWLGLEFDKPEQISMLEFLPRSDDNDISPGDTYELFYWNNKWISLGEQVAEGYELKYENVPSNAVFWLRNLTKGEEERPFTYENDKQIWW